MTRRGLRAAGELTVLGALASRRFDVLHSAALTAPLATRAANVVVIADTTWLTMPDMGKGQAATVRLWQAAVPVVARRADRVIAISEAGAGHVREHLRVDPARIDVVPLGYSPRPRAAPTPEPELRARLGLGDGPIVLNVAMKKVHKNQRRLVQALPRIREAVPGAQLVLAGAPTPYEAELAAEARALGLDGRRHAARLRRRRRPRGALRGRVGVRVPVAQRGLRAAGAGGDGRAGCRS